MGLVDVAVEYNGQNATLPLLVVKGNGPPLFGRDWMSVIRVNWAKIHYTPSTGLQGLLEQYSDVFKDSLQGLLEQYSDVFKHRSAGTTGAVQ